MACIWIHTTGHVLPGLLGFVIILQVYISVASERV